MKQIKEKYYTFECKFQDEFPNCTDSAGELIEGYITAIETDDDGIVGWFNSEEMAQKVCDLLNSKEKVCEIPPELNHLKFITAWSEWVSFRKEIKHKLTPTTQKKQLKMLAGLGVDGAVSTLNRSMENGWQGLFPEKTVQTNPLIGRQTKYINPNII